uniref:CoA transferase n=2 Tax=Bradyrhizobium liaoningense TaxID=43992 RepID=UPI000550D2AC
EAPPKPWPKGDRPLSGLRVLDLSRVIAGPVAGRTLAAHGADVLLVSGPELPAIPWLTIDTGRGKLTTFIELKSEFGRAQLRELLKDADIFSQGYRPRALAALGFAPEDAAQINPGIVYVTLSAYGHTGPWAERRGFDSLVQTTTGFNHEGQAAGIDAPRELPAQILDHATGYLMAFGAMMARVRQAREGGSWHVRVSLAQTGRWLWNLGRLDSGLNTPDLTGEAVHAAFIEDMPSGFGRLKAVRHSAVLSKTPARWTRPAMPLGSHPAQWPARS